MPHYNHAHQFYAGVDRHATLWRSSSSFCLTGSSERRGF
jgi:hypothetical protein